MNLKELSNKLPNYAKDIRLNLSSVITLEGAPDLTQKQLLGITLAAAFATKSAVLISAVLAFINTDLTETEIAAAKSAATIMGMNNVYYRFVHLVNDETFSKLPARLRMNAIGNSGIDHIDFELSALAVSAINGCGMCMEAHTRALDKAGVSKIAIQSAIRIAAVLNATATTMAIEEAVGL